MMFGGAGFGSGFLVGFGTGFVSRELAMFTMAIAKPIGKTLMRAGVMGIERGRESLAYLKESFDDMVAEVREGMEMRETEEEGEEGLEHEEEVKKKELRSEREEPGRGEDRSEELEEGQQQPRGAGA